MKFIELAEKRVSIRSYTKRPVSRKMLNEVLEAGRLAPSACNFQPFQFVVVKEPGNLTALAEAYPADWFAGAPLVIAVCTLPKKAWHRNKHDDRCYADVDAAIAADHMALAATELGLGSCWVGAFDPKQVRRVLQIPRSAEPLILLTLGHPDEKGRPKQRKPLDELVRFENWKGE
jgi:nitroreductase